MLFPLFVVVLLVNQSVADDQLNRLESSLKFLGEKYQVLEKQVAQQNEELIGQKKLLSDKSDEIKALKELLQLKNDNVDANTQGISALVNKDRRFVLDDSVAFFARLDETAMTGVATNQTISFDKVVLNAGNSFDAKTGQFTVPVDGFYLLSVSVASDLGHNHQLQVALMRNNAIVARAHAHGDSGHLDQGGITVVIGLAAGDKIYVKSTYDDVTDFYGNGLTTFSGFQIMFK